MHITVHQIADERLAEPSRLRSPRTLVLVNFARAESGRRGDHVADSDSLRPLDDVIRKRSSGRPFVPGNIGRRICSFASSSRRIT